MKFNSYTFYGLVEVSTSVKLVGRNQLVNNLLYSMPV